MQSALDAFGQVDVVVNNAGILRDAVFKNVTPELLDPVIDVHLKGAFNVLRHAWPLLREQNYGRIVNTTSGSGMFGNFGQSNYGAAKAGLMGLTACCRSRASATTCASMPSHRSHTRA